ncbi:unnamed protein product [Urochloa humidicola]
MGQTLKSHSRDGPASFLPAAMAASASISAAPFCLCGELLYGKQLRPSLRTQECRHILLLRSSFCLPLCS